MFVFSQVKKIQDTFDSINDYKESFIPLLLEEIHSDLSSCLLGVARAPFCELLKLKRDKDRFQLPNSLFYEISCTNVDGKYEPEFGDLILFTDIRPKNIDDLKFDTPKIPYHIAFVHGPIYDNKLTCVLTDKILVRSNQCISTDFESGMMDNEKQKLYAIHLMNMTTNVRIWEALKSALDGKIIQNVLRPHLNVRITTSSLMICFLCYFIFHFEMKYMKKLC